MSPASWLRAQGMPIPTDPNVTAIAGAISVVVFAFTVGWWIGQRAGPRCSACGKTTA